MSFGEQLRHYRERAGLTQKKLAAKAGLTTKAHRAPERAERRSSYPQTARALADALGLSQAERADLMQARKASLPTYLTPFIGREHVQDELALAECVNTGD